ncbi:MAG: PBECR2 nuclease fold domain-containing protein [Oscillospiraceae bacterium]|nr:PBECR2 nuclease fold domain-containing protein [Oscillospiraceae bacterium]
MSDENLIIVGSYNTAINDILGVKIDEQTIYRSKGLPAHMVKQRHFNCLKHIDDIPEIILNPDYIGLHIESDDAFSVEYIKVLKRNVLVAVKIDGKSDYLYVATVHDIQESKLQRRLHSGRFKKIENISEENENFSEKPIDK